MGMQYQAAAVDPAAIEAATQDGSGEQLMSLLDSGIYLDKMWHAAQVLIAGGLDAQEPLMTGQPVGDDLGYGPAHYATPDEVARVAEGLAGLTGNDLASRFDPQTMTESFVYPMVWDEDPDALRGEVTRAALELIGLYRTAASQGTGVLAAIT